MTRRTDLYGAAALRELLDRLNEAGADPKVDYGTGVHCPECRGANLHRPEVLTWPVVALHEEVQP